MNIAAPWNWARTQIHPYSAQLRFCLRMTVAALLAFVLAHVLTIPLHGLWAVLTAVVVTQMSVGGSLRATAEYVIGTLAGALYASAVGVLVSHTTAMALAGLLALTIAPLACAAALNPSFRVAPFTAALVLLISGQLGEGPIESALYRLLEVALGGAVAVTVSLLVFPQRAHGLGLDVAARILDQLAQILPYLLAGFTRKLDIDKVRRLQHEAGRGVASFQALAAESKRERLVALAAEPDPGPLSRTLLRLRHDLVMIGRAAVVPLPDVFAERLGPLLARMGASASDYLQGSATALASRRSPPSLDPVKAALEAYTSEITVLRTEGLMRNLKSGDSSKYLHLASPSTSCNRISLISSAVCRRIRDLLRERARYGRMPVLPRRAWPACARGYLDGPGQMLHVRDAMGRRRGYCIHRR
jgi:uncharacterized membrane protein YccC